MSTLKVSPLAKDLRALVDRVEKRLWIVSPYIGSWRAVRRILGEAWERVDVRLLTDKDSGILARDTLERFAVHRPVRSLTGVHAKLYVADDSVLLTSANLTETAFTRRYEAGLILSGVHAQELVAFYESLWSDGEDVELDSITFTKSQSGNVDESSKGGALPKLYELPGPPPAPAKGAGEFADYPYFLDIYREYVTAYLQAGARDEPKEPLYFETDKFLNYLFHDDPEKPSRAYKDKQARDLSEAKRVEELKKYRARYRKAGLDAPFHLNNAREIQRLLAIPKIQHLTKTEIETVARSLNCFGNLPLAKAKFLNNNDPAAVRKAWFELIHGTGDVKFRMNRCRVMLYGFGKSAIQETLGYYYPDKYPLRNENTNAGLRFLGFRI
jgi:PLD-like domain